jgi:hypothetical protein
VKPRRRDERAHPRQQVHRLEHDRDGAVAPRPLQRVAELAAGGLLEPLLRDGWPAQIAGEALELGAVAGRDGNVGVDVDAEALRAALVLARERRVDHAEEGLTGAVVGERGASRCDGAQRGQRELLAGWRRRVALAGAIERPAMASEGLLDPVRGPPGDAGELLDGGRGERVEDQRASLRVAHVDAAPREHVSMHVEPERRVTSLDDADGAGQRVIDGVEAEERLRAALQRAAQLDDERLGRAGLALADVVVDTRDTAKLPLADRRVVLEGRPYPVRVDDAAALRDAISAAQAKVGRAAGAKGAGNRTKRLRIWIAGEHAPRASELSALLARGQ